MNKRNINHLADVIESERWGFDMGDGDHIDAPNNNQHRCGSAGCIGGHATSEWPNVRRGQSWDHAALRKKLGITRDQHEALCFPDTREAYYFAIKGGRGHVTRARAVATLRRLAETGEVKW